MYKAEIEKRLRKNDYLRLPRILDFTESYEQLNDSVDQLKLLSIADKYGQKYIQFYKLKVNADINDVFNEIRVLNFQPNLPFVSGQSSIAISEVTKDNSTKNFSIMANFYTFEEIWRNTSDKTRELINQETRRTLWIDFNSDNNTLIVAIDPIGDGVKISQDIPNYINRVFEQFTDILFNDYFEIINITEPIYDMIDTSQVRFTKLKANDENSARSYEAMTSARFDTLTDEEIYKKTRNSDYDLNRMKIKHDDLDVSFELFGEDIIKITNKINWEQTDEFKRAIVHLL